PIVILQFYDRIIPTEAMDTFLVLMLGMLLVIVLDCILKTLRSAVLSWDSAKFDHVASLDAMDLILHSDTLNFDTKPAGYYIDKIQALEKIQEFYSGQSILLLIDLPFVLVYLILIVVIAGPLIGVPVGLLVLFCFISIIAGKKLHHALMEQSKMEDRKRNFVIEILQGIHTVKALAMESFMQRRYEKLQLQSAESVYELSRLNSIVQGIGATFSQLAIVSFVGFGSLYVVSGELTVGALAAGTMLTSRVLQPGLRAMAVWVQFQSVRLALQKVNELFTLHREESGELSKNEQLEGNIELTDVCFKYPGKKTNLIDQLSLSIKPGEAVGITGRNGVGKSTLIDLMSGFLQPSEGLVEMDGEALTHFNAEYLRSQIGIIPQHGVLFEGTVLENMTLYREGKAIEQAIEISKVLGLNDIISKLPNGLDTHIGGASKDSLPEGVKQKIVMVRSLVGYPKVIFLDDANANFDLKNDQKLAEILTKLKGRRTMVVISHRPSFLRLCDRQLELKSGKLRDYKLPSYPDKNLQPNSGAVKSKVAP
ncbi:MAG: ATP-binding cassette domain-containing protein, partial [Cycloclasticus sp.]|nr:ATP-binding cassette domain-containing protein [Cycloclasticus sp.]